MCIRDSVGISLDGIAETHDRFRRQPGAFAASLNGIRLCRKHGVKVGIRYTMTQDNAHDLLPLLGLLESEQIDKFYFSHLNYAGRGNRNRQDDAQHQTTRQAMDLLFEIGWQWVQDVYKRQGEDRDDGRFGDGGWAHGIHHGQP